MNQMTFNPDQFLEQEVTGAMDTEYVPCPLGEYPFLVTVVKARQWTKKDDPTVTGVAIDLIGTIEDAEVKELLGRDQVSLKQGIMLDLDENGQLDKGKGKNVQLGKAREALGCNEEGQPFRMSDMVGRMALASVRHRMVDGSPFAEVSALAPLG